MNENITIGAIIVFNKAYAAKLSKRIRCNSYDETGNNYHIDPLQLKHKTGIIVGLRSAIMTDIKYHSGKQYGDGEYEQGYVEGKRETCYLVTQRAFGKHFLVRKEDTISISTAHFKGCTV